MSPSINTKRSSNYRKLHFDSVDQCIAEVERIASASKNGTLKTSGNWTPGQIMAHLASWIEYGYIGYPIGAPPFFIRWFLKLQLKKMLRDGMSRGVRIPGLPNGTVGMDDMETMQGCERLLAALHKIKTDENCPYQSPAFGPMSHGDRILLNLRHAELHLGFLSY